MEDGNVFSIDSLNFDSPNTEIYNTNQIFNVNQIINEPVDTSKIIKLTPPKPKNQLNLNDNVPFSDINLLFNLDPVFDTTTTNEHLELNLKDIPIDDSVKEHNKSVNNSNKTVLVKNTVNKCKTTKKSTKNGAASTHPCNFCHKIFKKQSDLVIKDTN